MKKTRRRTKHKTELSSTAKKMDALRRTPAWAKWRKSVYVRDKFTCQICGKKKCYLEPHHILPKAKFPKLVFDINNGITLCWKCHHKTPGIHSGDADVTKMLQDKVAKNAREKHVRRKSPAPTLKRVRRRIR